MKAAGLNPMLAYSKGGATAPTSGSSLASGGGYPDNNLASSINSASQANLNEATASKVRAEEQEIRARTTTYPVTIEKMKQDITQSQHEIQKIIQETSTSGYSAQNIAQQTQNMIAVLPQIRATIENLKANTGTAYTLTGKHTAEEAEIRQRIEANLPKIESLFKTIEAAILHEGLPAAERSGAVHDTPILGELSALLRAFAGILPNVGIILRQRK